MPLPQGYLLQHQDVTGSTNTDAIWLVEAGMARHGMVVVADEQTAGRGRLGRTWHSPPGNLYATLILLPDAPQAGWFALPFIMALAIAEAVQDALPERRVELKWPNDVLVDDKKICGVLLERADGPDQQAALVAGFSVNCASFPDEARYPVTSLAAEGVKTEPQAMLGNVLAVFDRVYREWQAQGFSTVRDAWLVRAWHLQQEITVNTGQEAPLNGIFRGLGLDGALRLEMRDGTRHDVCAGDVLAQTFVSGGNSFISVSHAAGD